MKQLAWELGGIALCMILVVAVYTVGHLWGYQEGRADLQQWALDQGLAHTQKNQAGEVLYVWKGLSAPEDTSWSTPGLLKAPVVLRVSDK